MELVYTPNVSDFYPNVFGGLDVEGIQKKSMELYGKLCSLTVCCILSSKKGKKELIQLMLQADKISFSSE